MSDYLFNYNSASFLVVYNYSLPEVLEMLIAAIGVSNVHVEDVNGGTEGRGRRMREGRRTTQRWMTLTNSVAPRYKQGENPCENMCMHLHREEAALMFKKGAQAVSLWSFHICKVQFIHEDISTESSSRCINARAGLVLLFKGFYCCI